MQDINSVLSTGQSDNIGGQHKDKDVILRVSYVMFERMVPMNYPRLLKHATTKCDL